MTTGASSQSEREALRPSLRSMLLPISPAREDQALAAVEKQLSELTLQDRPVQLALDLDEWKQQGEASKLLSTVISAALMVGDERYGDLLAHLYLSFHAKLKEKFNLSHNEATLFLSHAGLIALLRQDQAMSAAQIARFLGARDLRVPFNWQMVDALLMALDLEPSLTRDQVEKLFGADANAEEVTFADSDIKTCILTIAETANRLGYSGDLRSELDDLLNPEIFWPYIQILHYQCVIAEFYDHAMTYLYEFNPRGTAASSLIREYEGLAEYGNPFLNNFKAVDRATTDWAQSRGTPQARVLVAILAGLENMGFAARKELAGWVRKMILRLMHLEKQPMELLPQLNWTNVKRVLSSVAEDVSKTRGVLEQRVVDALSHLLCSQNDGWRSRGSGDPVNASNLSRRKLGDCDYQKVTDKQVIAYEAHAGTLTQVYFEDHLRTLKKCLKLRSEEEWSAISDPEDWSVTIHLVAHNFTVEPPRAEVVEGIEVKFILTSFEKLLSTVLERNNKDEIVKAFNERVVKPINETRTPRAVRQVVRKLAEI